MWRRLQSIFRTSEVNQNDLTSYIGQTKNGTPDADRAQNVSDLVYPPRDPGLPIQTTFTLLNDQRDLLGMLRIHAAAIGPQFETRYLGPIGRLTEYANVLPGSSTSSFSGPGGLFRAALELAFTTFRASDGRIFTGASGVEERHKLESRWRYVCFIAGLLYPIGGALSRMTVLDERGKKWAPEIESLMDWAGSTGMRRLYVSWHTDEPGMGPSPLMGTFALKVVGRENLEWLNDGSPNLVKSLVDILTGGTASKNLIASSLVKEMWTAVNSRELARVHRNYGSLTSGSNVAPYIFDAMVGLSKSLWKLNETTMFADSTGLYLEWPRAGADIIAYCRRMDFQGIPANEAALLSIMTSTKLLDRGVDGEGQVEIADQNGEVKLAVKLAQPAMLLPDDITLDSFAKSRPVQMQAVMAADPLREKPPKTTSTSKPLRKAPVLEQLDIEAFNSSITPQAEENEDESAVEVEEKGLLTDESERNQKIELMEQQAAASMAPSATSHDASSRSKTSSEEVQTGRSARPAIESQEIRYSDFLSADLLQKLKPHEAEIMGKLVHAWRTKTSEGKMMRMCENGAAIELKFLASLMRNPPAFLGVLGELGMLYTAAATPSRAVYQVPVSEASPTTVTCFVLNHLTCKRLALT